MKFQKISLALVSLFLFGSVSASAMTTFSLVGAADFDMYDQTVGAFESHFKLGYGGGALIEFRGASLGVEVGGIYLSRQATLTVANVDTTTAIGVIHIPASLRLHLTPMFSVSAGGYYDTAVSNSSNIYSTNDNGIQGGLRISFAPSTSNGLFVAGEYHYGLKDYDSAGNKNKGVIALVGYSFGSK